MSKSCQIDKCLTKCQRVVYRSCRRVNLYPSLAVAALAIGVILWLLRDNKRAKMLLTAETTLALNAAKSEAKARDEAAEIIQKTLTDRVAELTAERDSLAKDVKTLNAALENLQQCFGLAKKMDYTAEELQAALTKEKHSRALGLNIHSMLTDARRRGLL